METIDLLLPEVDTSGNLSTMQLPNIDDYDFWNLYLKRIICIDGEITTWDYHIVREIIQFNMQDIGIPKESRKPIILLINSFGGDLEIMFAIIDAIAASTTPVWTVNMGEALSAGGIIFIAGEKRFATNNSWCMTHLGSGTLSGSYNDTVEAKKQWDAQIKNIGAFITSRTNIDEKLWKKNKDKNWYLDANQQLELGVATDKFESIDQLFEMG